MNLFTNITVSNNYHIDVLIVPMDPDVKPYSINIKIKGKQKYFQL